jgi:hypothetical protein
MFSRIISSLTRDQNFFLAFISAHRSAGEDLSDLNNAVACNQHCLIAMGWRTIGITYSNVREG